MAFLTEAEQAIIDELKPLAVERGAHDLFVLLPNGKPGGSDPLGDRGFIGIKAEIDGQLYGDYRSFTEIDPGLVIQLGRDLIEGGWVESLPRAAKGSDQ